MPISQLWSCSWLLCLRPGVVYRQDDCTFYHQTGTLWKGEEGAVNNFPKMQSWSGTVPGTLWSGCLFYPWCGFLLSINLSSPINHSLHLCNFFFKPFMFWSFFFISTPRTFMCSCISIFFYLLLIPSLYSTLLSILSHHFKSSSPLISFFWVQTGLQLTEAMPVCHDTCRT